MAKITIILPVYNVEKYLVQSLESVIHQTLEDIEIICINDFSSDNSLTILEGYSRKDSRIKIINLSKNHGAGYARNIGLKQATGEYIMFLDPDDWYEHNTCELAYNQILQNKNDIVIFNYNEFVDGIGKYNVNCRWRILPFEKVLQNPNIKLKNLQTNFIQNSFIWCEIYSRNLLQKNNIYFPEDISLGEDSPFFVKALVYSDSISVIDKPLYNYRVRKTSTSFKFKNLWEEVFISKMKCFDIIENSRINEFINPCIVFSINSLFYWFNCMQGTPLRYQRQFYNKFRKFLLDINKKYPLSRVKESINYKKCKKIMKYNWTYYVIILFLNKIFNVHNNGIHKIFEIFGIKISIRKDFFKVCSISKNDSNTITKVQLPFYSFDIKNKKFKNFNKDFLLKKKTIEISKYPPATGILRNLQLANFYLLNFVDKICKESNISYWLDFGTLLGATRHGGFIPWDDDIDISMMREDFEKIYDLINNNSYDSDIYAEFHRHENPDLNSKRLLLKIKHKKCPTLFVDIFPYDYLGLILDYKEQLALTKIIKYSKQVLQQNQTPEMLTSKIKSENDNLRKWLLRDKQVPDDKSDVIWGLDYEHGWSNWIYSHSTIFTLQDITFEGKTFKCPNIKEEYLSKVYGNYMSYPSNIGFPHNMFKEFSPEEYKIICDLAKKVEDKK